MRFLRRVRIFSGLIRIAFGTNGDKNNRVIVAEQVLNGRLQVFRYTTDAEAAVEQAKREHRRRNAGSSFGTPAGSQVNR